MLYGAIIGDIVGSKYEFNNYRSKNFDFFDNEMFFTDDTVMSIAVCKALANTYKNNYKNISEETVKQMQQIGRKYPLSGYGGNFFKWVFSINPQPYNSFGNGSAMRVSSVAYFAKSLDEVKKLSKAVSEVTHNHKEGIKGAEATAVAIYLALHGKSKEEIRKHIEENYYPMDYNYYNLQATYMFNETCQETVPQALYCFFESKSFEDTIRTGISIGGDSDTLCAIAGSVAEAYYGIDDKMKREAVSYLDRYLKEELRQLELFAKENLNKKFR